MQGSKMSMMKRALLGIALACCLSGGASISAQAQDAGPHTYAVMSLIGDTLSVSPYMGLSGSRVVTKGLGGWDSTSSGTGSRLNAQQDLATPVKETLFDDAATAEISSAIRQRDPGAVVVPIPARNTGWYGLQDRLFSASAKDSREALKAMLKEHKATYLIVVTKRRSKVEMLADQHLFADAQLQLLTGSSEDSLRLEGIGFYVDDAVRVQSLKTLDRSTGVLASFINASVRLVDSKTLEFIREQTVTRSKIIAISKPLEAGFSAWDEATEAQKAESLQELIRASMAETVPGLLKKAP
jgi:hypothetical protein